VAHSHSQDQQPGWGHDWGRPKVAHAHAFAAAFLDGALKTEAIAAIDDFTAT
jgi:hypothetical protein